MDTRDRLYVIFITLAVLSGISAIQFLVPASFSIAFTANGIVASSSGVEDPVALAAAAVACVVFGLAAAIAYPRTATDS